MPVILSVELANDTIADADDVMQNFNDLAGKFTEGDGGIGDDDFTANVGRKLDGSKIALNSIEGTSLKEEAVTETKLAHDDTDSSGTDALRAVSGYHIKSLTVAHVARLLPANGIALDKLEMATQSRVFDATSGPTVGIYTTDVATSPALATANTIILGFYFQGLTNFSPADIDGFWAERITTGANWGIRLHISAANNAHITGNIVIVSIGTTT